MENRKRTAGMWRLAAAAGSVAVGAVVGALAMPRGPLTTGQALASLAAGLGIGVFAGYMTRSRWAVLVSPLLFALVYELVRIGEVGPTVDLVHPGSVYGVVAFVSGRGVHGVLVLLPMLIGAGLGNLVSRPGGLVRHKVTAVVCAAAIVALAIAVAAPASTEPIRDARGAVVPGSVAELVTVDVRGVGQTLMLRGRSGDAPLLLFLAGGPGGSEIGSMRKLCAGLEEQVVVATWDQPGAGKSLAAFDAGSTLDDVVDDTIAVTQYLRDRFGKEKIYLVGNSWGTILGVLAAQRRPDLYYAYVGAGQMVDPVETDRAFYADTLAWADRTGQEGLAAQLRDSGEPPYEDLWDYEAVLSHEHAWNVYPMVPGFQEKGEMPGNILVQEYTLLEKLRMLGAFLDSFSVLYPQLARVDLDLRTDAPELEIPVYLVQGAHEARGRAELAYEWFDVLRAPAKTLVEFPRSGHKPSFEEPERFVQVMSDVVSDRMTLGR